MRITLGTLVMGILLVGPVAAQNKHPRKGFWFNGGLGYGSLGCQDCDGRTGAVTGQIALGGTISQKVLLGASTNAWTKSEDGATLSATAITAVVHFYPSATGGFYLTGGLGIGVVDLRISSVGSASETGFGALLGLGYDIRLGTNLSLTPFWNGFGINSSRVDANVGQIGLSITAH